jgi:protocatechuate 3,4-dioxygenase beta subunit
MGLRFFLKISLLFFILSAVVSSAETKRCPPTEPDMLGPFYKANAPVRSSVGKGYILDGVVRSSKDCSLIRSARIEFWLNGPDRQYDDSHRATVYSDDKGAFRFESNYPKPYYGRPPHIHIRVSAQGFRTLVTQHYPAEGKSSATFDLVLIPSSTDLKTPHGD